MKMFLSTMLASTMILSMTTASFATEFPATEEKLAGDFQQLETKTLSASPEDDFEMTGSVLTKYTGDASIVVIPSTIGGKTVREIGPSAFSNAETWKTLEGVYLPDTVEVIDSKAFFRCEYLREVRLSENLDVIGSSAFADCKRLASIWIPSKVSEIQEGAFQSSGITSVFVPKSVRTMGKEVFKDCTKLESTVFKATLIELPEGTYSGCIALTDVKLMEGIDSIGRAAFTDCSFLKSIEIPLTVKKLGYDAFAGCTKLERMDMSNTKITYLHQNVFGNCTSLTEVIMPYGFVEFEVFTGYSNAYTPTFYNCSSLAKVVIPSTTEGFGSIPLAGTVGRKFLFAGCPNNLAIYGYEGTYAETYAENFQHTFVSLGDVSKENTNPTYTPLVEPADPEQPVIEIPDVSPPDIPGVPEWAMVYAQFVASKIMPDISGYNYNTPATRGTIASSLYNMCADGGTATSTHGFTDVGDYGTAISWCYANTVMSGNSATLFGTEDNVTREQFALILQKASDVLSMESKAANEVVLVSYGDEASISSWARTGTAWAVSNGLMSGNNNNLNPQGNITRAEVAVMLYNFYRI